MEDFGPRTSVDDDFAGGVSRRGKWQVCAWHSGGLLRCELPATRDAQCGGAELLCIFSAPVQFFENDVRIQFFSRSGTRPASELASSVTLASNRRSEILPHIVARFRSIGSSLFSSALTSSSYRFRPGDAVFLPASN